MEKGMKAQLKIGKGSGDLPSIPGVTANVIQDDYSKSIPEVIAKSVTANKSAANTPGEDKTTDSAISGVMIIGLAVGLLLAPFLARKFKGMSAGEIISTIFEMIAQGMGMVVKLITGLINMLSSKKSIELPKE
jgi:predicted lipid-binding transport protein (Tim44 family)